MGLLVNTIALLLLSILFSSLLPPTASFPIQFQPSLQHQGGVNAQQHLSLPTVPRKLRFTEKVEECDEARDLASLKPKDSLPAGKQNMVLGKKGTRQEWMEGDDPFQYFTMDYSRVRRRRPIHNKRLPVGP